MLCPGCQSLLQVEVVGGIHLDVCTTCAGVWFDESELGRFVALDEMTTEAILIEPAQDFTDVSALGRRCPKCEITLHSHYYAYSSPYLIDSCPECSGIFVDQNEVKGIEHYHGVARDLSPAQTVPISPKLQYDTEVMKERAKSIARSVWVRRSRT